MIQICISNTLLMIFMLFDYSSEIDAEFLFEITKNWKQAVAWKLQFLEYLSGIHGPQKPYSANFKQLFLKDYLGGEGKASFFFIFIFYSSTVSRIVSCFLNIPR